MNVILPNELLQIDILPNVILPIGILPKVIQLKIGRRERRKGKEYLFNNELGLEWSLILMWRQSQFL